MTPGESHAHFLRSRREAVTILAVFAAVFGVVIAVAKFAAYPTMDGVIRAGPDPSRDFSFARVDNAVPGLTVQPLPMRNRFRRWKVLSYSPRPVIVEVGFPDPTGLTLQHYSVERHVVPPDWVIRLWDTGAKWRDNWEPIPLATSPEVLLVDHDRIIAVPDPKSHPVVLDLPAWVVWGVFTPWIACIGITFWFCRRGIADQPTIAAALAPPEMVTPAYRVEPTDGNRSN